MNGSFLLDTNIVSELMRPRPAANVATWVGSQEIAALFLSVVTVGELEAGFETMLDAHRRAQLEALLERLISRLFAERVLPITQAIAARWKAERNASNRRKTSRSARRDDRRNCI